MTVADGAEVVAGVELGGTKALAVLASGSTITHRSRVPTTTPTATLRALGDQLTQWRADGHAFAAIGIGCFGPVGLDPARADFGHITTTPKAGWANTDVRGHFARAFDVPVGLDTDVTGAALAEGRWGAARGCTEHIYITIGTGIGAGIIVGGRPVHGLVHPELGHLRVRRRPGDTFAGVCPYHGDCIEGLASGPAIAARAGMPADQLGPEHPVWADVTDELAELMTAMILAVSPQRIVVGGGVGNNQRFLFDQVRTSTRGRLAGYVAALDDAAAMEALIVPPGLGDDAGPLGAVALGVGALGGSAG